MDQLCVQVKQNLRRTRAASTPPLIIPIGHAMQAPSGDGRMDECPAAGAVDPKDMQLPLLSLAAPHGASPGPRTTPVLDSEAESEE